MNYGWSAKILSFITPTIGVVVLGCGHIGNIGEMPNFIKVPGKV